MSLKVLADELAKHGRFGDTQLLHVHKDELAGLASLSPNGKLTINPKTGLPEAFFFLPFLASLFGGAGAAAAPAALAAGTAAATGAGGALASGLATGLSAASALPAAATGAAAALPAAGIDALTTSSIAAPAATAALNTSPLVVGTSGAASMAPLAASPAGLGGAAAGGISMPAVAAPVSPIAASAVTPAAAAPASVAAPATTGMAPAVMPIEATPGTGVGAFAGSPAVDKTLDGMVSKGIKGLANMNPLTMMMLGQGVSSLGGMLGKKKKGDDEDAPDISGTDYYSKGGVDPVFPGSSYKPGKDNEWDYFPGMAEGGLVGYAYGGQIQQMPARAPNVVPPRALLGQGVGVPMNQGIARLAMPTTLPQQWTQGRHDAPSMPLQGGIIPNQWRASAGTWAGPPMMTRNGRAAGGLIKGYADGGIASLANPPPGAGMLNGMPQSTMPQMQQPGQAMQPGMEPDPNSTPTSPYPKSQIGSPSDGDKELIAQTVAAIKGKHPNPNGILLAFVQEFGEQALQDLVARVKGQPAGQPAGGDGLSDSIPATIEGQQPAALSEGEFVVPSDVVSHLGNGSTDAGAGHLQNMVARTRAARGAPQTPPAIDASQMMPA